MMSVSDSEEFASADEEVSDAKKKSEKESMSEQTASRAGDSKEENTTTNSGRSDAPLTAIQRQPCGSITKDDDQTKDARKALDSLSEKTTQNSASGGGGWGFSSWGSSLISTARSSVSTLTTQLGDGINVVMETVESALDVPPPEKLEKEEKENKTESTTTEKKDSSHEQKDENPKSDSSWWSAGWGVTSSVVTSGRSLMSGGLDVLETIGKRTMEVLHETDPGLSRTKSLLRSGRAPGTTLSQALREARQKHEEECQREEKWEEERKGHFGAQFEDCQGMAHLEALEMLSSQCEARLHSQLNRLSGEDLKTRKRDVIVIKQHFEKVENDDEEGEDEERREKKVVMNDVKNALKPFHLGAAQELLRVHGEVEDRVKKSEGDCKDEEMEDSEKVLQSVNQTGIQLLALISSSWVGLFHKAGELALAGGLKIREQEEEEEMSAKRTAELLVNCALVASQDISCIGEEVADLLRKFLPDETKAHEEQKRLSTQLITGIYLETGNSRAYVRDAFLLLLPVLQLAACN